MITNKQIFIWLKKKTNKKIEFSEYQKSYQNGFEHIISVKSIIQLIRTNGWIY